MKNMFRIVGLVIGVIILALFLAPLMVAGVFNIGNATGIILFVMWIFYMAFMPQVHNWIKRLWQKRMSRLAVMIIGGVATLCVILAVVETGCIIATCAQKPAEDATVIVLGCRVYGERPSLSMVERLEAAYDYLAENPEAVCIVSGGKGDGENIPEAECMYRWLVGKGIYADRIYIEERSTSTEENIQFSKEIIEEKGLSENIAIVTSEYHMYRAGIIAKENGLEFGAVPGKTAVWLFPTFYVRELYAILAEWIF